MLFNVGCCCLTIVGFANVSKFKKAFLDSLPFLYEIGWDPV